MAVARCAGRRGLIPGIAAAGVDALHGRGAARRAGRRELLPGIAAAGIDALHRRGAMSGQARAFARIGV
jgi:hypothetical protein